MQRIAIISYPMGHRTHPSVDEIYTAFAPSIPTLSKITVYNTLKLLSEQGTAQTLTAGEWNICCDTETNPRIHFLRKQCSEIYGSEYNINIKQVRDTDMDGRDVREIRYRYKGIYKNCLGSEQLTRVTNNQFN